MTEKHCGDCTNQSHSCVVCGTDGYLLHSRQIIAALTGDVAQAEQLTPLQALLNAIDYHRPEINKGKMPNGLEEAIKRATEFPSSASVRPLMTHPAPEGAAEYAPPASSRKL